MTPPMSGPISAMLSGSKADATLPATKKTAMATPDALRSLRTTDATSVPHCAEQAKVEAGYVVRMIRTLHGAWCDTLFGTEPSRNRFAPVIPLLPTTISSAFSSSATSRIASAGSP